ncbi:dUTP diphosphatase [Paenibacillus motobuensis]|uniref:dUTP diphosphatase n=1 Tax=Paenibacillus motobuensis TaxID=295324 RepID=UPI0036408221
MRIGGDKVIVNIKRLHPDAHVPKYATELAAGFDLVAVEDVIISPGETALVPLGFAIEIPPGYEMQIRDRSGIASKTKLRVANSPGTVDGDFRGEVKVIVDNIAPVKTKARDFIDQYHHEECVEVEMGVTYDILNDDALTSYAEHPHGTYIIRKGDRIAQGVIAAVERITFAVVEELAETVRGAGGFGHTGITAEEAAVNIRKAFAELPTMAEGGVAR